MKHPFTGRYYDGETEYLTAGLCDNCGHGTWFNVPKGFKRIDYLKGCKCEECGCRIIELEKTRG